MFFLDIMEKQAALFISAIFLPLSFGIYSNQSQILSNLHTDLIQNIKYKTSIRPELETNVQFAYTLVSINDFDEIKGKIYTVGIIYVTWNDLRLSWNTDDYAGIRFISVHLRDIWRPDISLLNTAGKFEIFDYLQDKYIAWVTAKGQVHYSLGGVYSASCDPDVTYFPFDVHECFLTFVPFSDIFFLDVFKNMSIELAEPHFNSSDISDEDGEWKYHPLTPCVRNVGNSNLFGAIFPIRLQRRWKFVFCNVIIPVFILGYLNLFVFFIPVEAGERVSFAITLLLSYTVFMIVTAETIPETSSPMPLLSYFLVFKLVYSSCIVISSINISRIYHRKQDCPIAIIYRRLTHAVECIEKDILAKQEDKENVNTDENDSEVMKEPLTLSWVRVSKALDKILMTLFFVVIVTETIVFFAFLLQSYSKNILDMSSKICGDFSECA
ncbi:hypothetical protein FSP39_015940 [Pinctada imbricata]|uniref:Uncharacterized protein n=1 Tax=Pinctada imbricata TaxID=66713 RepID=A0AA88XSL0_PINIB|nr:hypothetical protein FSP39_015940 [Pinctada imbricata]